MTVNYSTINVPSNGRLVEMVELGVTHWPIAVTTALLMIAAYAIQSFLKEDQLAKLPRIGSDDLRTRWLHFLGEGSWDMYLEGYKKWKDRPWKITDGKKRDRIVLPHTMLPELAKYPDEVLSTKSLGEEIMQTEYTLRLPSTVVFKRVLLSELTPALVRLTPSLREEVVSSMTEELPDSSEWTEVAIQDKILRIVAISTGRILVGPECGSSQVYIDNSSNHTVDMARAASEIVKLPRLLRPIVAPWLKSTRKVQKRMDDFIEVIQPVIETRRREAAEQGEDYQKHDDMTQWMIDAVHKVGQREIEDIALEHASISFASVNSTAQHASLAFFSLAAHPEIEDVLLQDVNEALEKHGGEWTNAALHDMKRLDSFLKEVGRLEPFTAYSFARRVLQPVTLSNGLHLPKNSILEVDWYGIAHDDDIYPNAEEFDALRFYKQRQEMMEKNPGKSTDAVTQFVNISPTHLTWNYGKRACPGRFFAANILKLMFATLLLRYQIRNVDGVEGRVKNVRGVGNQATNPTTKAMIRKR